MTIMQALQNFKCHLIVSCKYLFAEKVQSHYPDSIVLNKSKLI